MSEPDASLYQLVCELLFVEWDPIGVNGFAPCDEYDSYAAGLIRVIADGADEHEVAHRLADFARLNMGLTHVDHPRDRRVARLLIDLLR